MFTSIQIKVCGKIMVQTGYGRWYIGLFFIHFKSLNKPNT